MKVHVLFGTLKSIACLSEGVLFTIILCASKYSITFYMLFRIKIKNVGSVRFSWRKGQR